MNNAIAFRDEVLRQIDEKLQERIADGTLDDFSPGRAESIAQAAGQSIEREVRFHQAFGSFYRIERVRGLLGDISRQAVYKRVSHHRLLRVITSDDVHLFPSFQFTEEGVDPHVRELVSILGKAGLDEWSILYWLTTPVQQLGGTTAVEAIRQRRHYDILRRLAREDGASWVPPHDTGET